MALKDPLQAKLLKPTRARVNYGPTMLLLCQDIGAPAPQAEYRFCERLWRFDFAWPSTIGGVAVEVDGGILTGGRHTSSISGRLRDMEKLDTAASLGWLVLMASTLKAPILDKQKKHRLPWLSLADPQFTTLLGRALASKGLLP